MKNKKTILGVSFNTKVFKIIIVILSLTMLFLANYGLIFNNIKLVTLSSAIIILNYLILHAVKIIQLKNLSSNC